MKTRRITALLLAAAMSVGLCACSSGSGAGDTTASGDSAQASSNGQASQADASEDAGGVLPLRQRSISGLQVPEKLNTTRLSGNALITTVRIIPV